MEQKIALITGGGRGLGRDMAYSLAKKDTDVIITYVKNKEEADKTVAEISKMNRKALAMHLDAGNIKSFDNFITELKVILQDNWQTDKFDYLINNGGLGATLLMPQVTEEAFDLLMNVHFKGVYFLTQKSLPHINDNGCVIFISSGTTRFCVPGYSVYSSLKSAVETLTKYVAKENGQRGIRSNIVAPGPIETDFNNAGIRNNPQAKAFMASQTALGRVGQADDIGSVVAFLCSGEAKWINGQRIEVSGGISL